MTVLAGLLISAAWSLGRLDTRPEVPWWFLIGAFAATEVFVVLLRYRSGSHSISLCEIPLVIGLVFAGPLVLIVARVVGAVAAVTLHRRQSGVKLAFNVAHFAFEAALAVCLFRAILGSGDPLGPRGWAAALAATIAVDVVAAILITAAITLFTGVEDKDMLQGALLEGLVAAIGTTALALVSVTVMAYDLRAASLLAVLGAVLFLAYREHSRLSYGHERLEMLYDFTTGVGKSVAADEVMQAVLSRTRDLLRAERAALVIFDDGPTPTVVAAAASLGADNVLCCDGTANAPSWSVAVLDGSPLLVARGETSDALADLRGPRDLVVVPLMNDDQVVGALMAENRNDDVSTFDPNDVRLLEGLAGHSRVALENSRLVDRLRVEATNREHQALHDGLTGLANRRLFVDRVEAALLERDVAVLLMDLDRFKEVNDTLGHHVGDEVLLEVGKRLAASVPAGATVARLGGDEFAVVLPGIQEVDEAAIVASRLRSLLEGRLVVRGMAVDVSASIGIAIAPRDGADASSLLQHADVAMYTAKADGTGVELYRSARDHYSPLRLALAGDLRDAIDRERLDVFYQPKVDVHTGHMAGVEALIRWFHPERGNVPPDEFIPLAETTGLIVPLTTLVLRSALTRCAEWHADGLDVGMAVNISPRNLLDPELPETIAGILRKTGLPPTVLTLEIIENSIMGDTGRTMSVLHRLDALGVRLSIDDFGTGHSSLAYLKRLPVDEVKIDKTFVFGMGHDPADAAIVRSTIELGHNLGLTVVAEGVEGAADWQLLESYGCDVAQGFFFGRPMPGSEIERWQAKRAAHLPAGEGVDELADGRDRAASRT